MRFEHGQYCLYVAAADDICAAAGLSIPPEMEQILQESRDSVREAKIQLVMLDQGMVTRYATRHEQLMLILFYIL